MPWITRTSRAKKAVADLAEKPPTVEEFEAAVGDAVEVEWNWSDPYAALVGHQLMLKHGFQSTVDRRVPGGTIDSARWLIAQKFKCRDVDDAADTKTKSGVITRFVMAVISDFRNSLDKATQEFIDDWDKKSSDGEAPPAVDNSAPDPKQALSAVDKSSPTSI